jgi:hypothetical protein
MTSDMRIRAALLATVTVSAGCNLIWGIVPGIEKPTSSPVDAGEGGVPDSGANAGGMPEGGMPEGGMADGGCDASTTNDPENCGSCGHVCGGQHATLPACSQSKCVFACDPGFLHCSSNDADGCETDTTTDGANCGSCGHSCQVETCKGGQCVPTVVTTWSKPQQVAVDTTNVYFTTGTPTGDVLSAPIATGMAMKLASLPNANYIAVDGQGVYVSVFVGPGGALGEIDSVPLDGGASHVSLTPGGVYEPNGVVAQGGIVFFASQGTLPPGNPGYIGSVPTDGGTGPTPLVPNQLGPEQLALDGTNVYFNNFDNGGETVVMAPRDGTGPPTVLAYMTYPSKPYGIAVGGSYVYVSDNAIGGIYQVPITTTPPDGGVPLTLPMCADTGSSGNVVVDASHVYWVNSTTNTVNACSLGAPHQVTTLASNLNGPTGLAQDGVSLFVGDTNKDRVLRINKP